MNVVVVVVMITPMMMTVFDEEYKHEQIHSIIFHSLLLLLSFLYTRHKKTNKHTPTIF
jgi:hypothetical protein